MTSLFIFIVKGFAEEKIVIGQLEMYSERIVGLFDDCKAVKWIWSFYVKKNPWKCDKFNNKCDKFSYSRKEKEKSSTLNNLYFVNFISCKLCKLYSVFVCFTFHIFL